MQAHQKNKFYTSCVYYALQGAEMCQSEWVAAYFFVSQVLQTLHQHHFPRNITLQK